MAVPLVMAGRPDMDSSNPAYANNAARCDREEEIYQVRGLQSGRTSLQMHADLYPVHGCAATWNDLGAAACPGAGGLGGRTHAGRGSGSHGGGACALRRALLHFL